MALTAQDLIKMYQSGGSTSTTNAINSGVANYSAPIGATPPKPASPVAPIAPVKSTTTAPTLQTMASAPKPSTFFQSPAPTYGAGSTMQSSTPQAMASNNVMSQNYNQPVNTASIMPSTTQKLASEQSTGLTGANGMPFTMPKVDSTPTSLNLNSAGLTQGTPSTTAPKNLYEYYKGAMPSLETRAKEYERLGLGTASDYIAKNRAGDPKPNQLLLEKLNAGNAPKPLPDGSVAVLNLNADGTLMNTGTQQMNTGVNQGTQQNNPVVNTSHARTEQEMDKANGGQDVLYNYDASGARTGLKNDPALANGTAGTSVGGSGVGGGASGAPQNATQEGGLIQQLLRAAQMSDAEQALRQQSGNLQTQLAEKLGQNAQNPIPLEFQTGRAQALQNMASQKQSALESQIQSYAQQRGISGDVLGKLMQQIAPGTSMYDLTTGKTLAGLGGAGQNGMDAYRTWANTQFNTQQGQQLGAKFMQMKTALDQTDKSFELLKSTAAKTGINPTPFPTLNAFLQQLTSQFGGESGEVAAFQESLNAFSQGVGALLNSGAFTPTEIGAFNAQMSPSNLSPANMQVLYDTIRKTAESRMNPLLDQAKAYEQGGGSSVIGGQQPYVAPAGTGNTSGGLMGSLGLGGTGEKTVTSPQGRTYQLPY